MSFSNGRIRNGERWIWSACLKISAILSWEGPPARKTNRGVNIWNSHSIHFILMKTKIMSKRWRWRWRFTCKGIIVRQHFIKKCFSKSKEKLWSSCIGKFHFKTNGELLYLTGKAITKAYVPTMEENFAEQHFVCLQNCFGAWQAWSATWKSEPFFNSKVICPNMEYDSKATYQQTLPKALRTQALTALTKTTIWKIMQPILWFGSVGLVGLVGSFC